MFHLGLVSFWPLITTYSGLEIITIEPTRSGGSCGEKGARQATESDHLLWWEPREIGSEMSIREAKRWWFLWWDWSHKDENSKSRIEDWICPKGGDSLCTKVRFQAKEGQEMHEDDAGEHMNCRSDEGLNPTKRSQKVLGQESDVTIHLLQISGKRYLSCK